MADIKPMQVGEILDGALTIYRRNAGLFTRLGIIALAGPVIYFAILASRMTIALAAVSAQLRVGVQPSLGLWAPLLPFLGYLVVGSVIYYLGAYFLMAGAMRIISDTYLGRAPRLRDALALGGSKMLPLCGVALAKLALYFLLWVACGIGVGVLVGIGSLLGKGVGVLALVAGFVGLVWAVAFVASGYGLTAQVVTLEEGVGVFGAFARSWDLTRQSKLKVFGVALLGSFVFYLIPYVIVVVITVALQAIAPVLGIVGDLTGRLLPIVCAPLFVCCLTLLYYDLRVRREAFDLQQLSERLGMA
jgi:hypothetical protein